jgi:hypothetical protein
MERVSRRKILAAGSGAALASALVGTSSVSAQIQRTRPPGQPLLQWLERFSLAVDVQRGDSLRPPGQGNQAPTGPAYWTGTLWGDGEIGADGRPVAGAVQRGVWRAVVWVYVPGTTPQFTGVHSLDLFARGQLTAAGVTDSSVAITGGTGEFQAARGEIRMATIGTTGAAYTLEVEAIAPSTGY